MGYSITKQRTMTSRLGRLLYPQSLAFIGGVAAELAIDACQMFGFEGEMWGVNPHRQLGRVKTVASVSELPESVDAALVAVPCDVTVEVVRHLAERNTGAVVCYASGFAESGPTGADLQRQLKEAAANMPLVGPNCYGTLSAVTGAALWPDLHGLARCDLGVGLISQSGNIALNLTMQKRGLDVAHVVALGNQADVGLAETLEAFVADESVTGVGLYVEAVDDINRFAAAASEARRRGLPVVALKVGASEVSSTIAITHTASMTSSDEAYDAFFRRIGVRRVHTVSELLDTLAITTSIGRLRGRRVVSLSCSGGEAGLVADRGDHYDLTFPEFTPEHSDRVAETLDRRVAVTNPLDYHTFIWGDEARLIECFTAVLGGGSGADCRPFDAAMLVLDFPAVGLDPSRWLITLTAFGVACATTSTPGILVAMMAENLDCRARLHAANLGLATCAGIDNALSALEAAAWFGLPYSTAPDLLLPAFEPEATQQKHPQASILVSDRRPSVSDRIQMGAESASSPSVMSPEPASSVTSSEHETKILSEHEAKKQLASAGIVVPQGRLVPTGDAVSAAAEIGYPVVVKVSGLAHKTDIDGVLVGLSDPAEVASVATRLGVLGDGNVLVEECVAGVVAELLVSVRSEPPVGMLLTLGAGGTLVELLADTVNLLLPVSPSEILESLRRLRLWPVLSGHRGCQPAAVNAVVDTVVAIGSMMRQQQHITDIEINPLLVTDVSAVAVDALMVSRVIGEEYLNDR